MSQKLLQGYAMLADSCPDCGVPLLREPGGGSIICVSCTADSGYPTPEDSQQKGAAASAAIELQQAAKQSPGNNKADEENLLEPPLALSLQLETAQQGGAAAAASTGCGLRQAAAVASGDAVSKRIADKMLEGWALLDDSCPRCHTVLVRNRQRQMFCVGCDMFVVREQPQQQQQQQQQDQHPREGQQLLQQAQDGGESTIANGVIATALAKRGSAGEASPTKQLPAASRAALLPTGVPGKPLLAAQRPGSAAQAAGAGALGVGVAADGNQLVTAVDVAAAAVGAKLQQAAEELPGADAQQAQQLVVLIQSCAEALSALTGCKRKLAGS
ncbi:hypothetical protein N2152v2_003214 [Parachlorella kessleri]